MARPVDLAALAVAAIAAVLSATVPSAAAFATTGPSSAAGRTPVRSSGDRLREGRPLGPLASAGSNDRDDGNDVGGDDDDDDDRRTVLPDRRDALFSLSALASASSILGPSNAVDLPDFLLPPDRRSDGGVYKPAKRATAYLVDSTIPPSLVPFRASREAAILKGLGQGSGTSKGPFLQERINLNNVMNKAVFGTARAVGDLIRGGPEGARAGPGYASFLFLGTEDVHSAKDAELALGLIEDVVRPRKRGSDETALGLAFVPRSGQAALNEYAAGKIDDGALMEAMATVEADVEAVRTYLPLVKYARSVGVTFLALAPEASDLRLVRTDGIQSLDPDRRSQYVVDPAGFIALTQDPQFKLYADKSLLRDFVPKSDGDSPGDYFAERIIAHEAAATACARWASTRPDSLVIAVAKSEDVRYLVGGVNGRIPRISKALDPENCIVDDEAVTTILLNPTARGTLSVSTRLRLEIGTSPDNKMYQTKVADYIWFSDMPKVNLLTRMMNYA